MFVTATDYSYCEEPYYDWRTEASTIYSSSSRLHCFEGLFFLKKEAATRFQYLILEVHFELLFMSII